MDGLPRAILFDLDDTIISFGDREQFLIEVARRQFPQEAVSPEEIGRTIEADFKKFWADEENGRIWRFKLLDARTLMTEMAFQELQRTSSVFSPGAARRFAETFHTEREQQAKFFPRALETLDFFRAKGVKLALVTNGDATAQRGKVVRFGLESRFDHIQIEGEVGFGKPVEQAYIHAIDTLGVAASETWMVGDNLEWEVQAPQRLGIYSIWHDHFGRGLPADSSIVPDRVVRLISELME